MRREQGQITATTTTTTIFNINIILIVIVIVTNIILLFCIDFVSSAPGYGFDFDLCLSPGEYTYRRTNGLTDGNTRVADIHGIVTEVPELQFDDSKHCQVTKLEKCAKQDKEPL